MFAFEFNDIKSSSFILQPASFLSVGSSRIMVMDIWWVIKYCTYSDKAQDLSRVLTVNGSKFSLKILIMWSSSGHVRRRHISGL